MKLTFFGSSHGVPEPNRRCSCILLEVSDRKYLIDVGTDPVPLLIDKGLTPCDVSAVFITHVHGDHTNGLVPFADICSWRFKDADPLIFLPEIEMLDALKGWVKLTCEGLRETLRFKEVKEGLLYDDGKIRVTAAATQHRDRAYAYLIEAEGKRVLFTGDMRGGDGPVADYARFAAEESLDLAVAECAHFDASLYLEPLKKHPPKLFCINHYSRRWLESCCKLLKEIAPDIPALLATDGLEINL